MFASKHEKGAICQLSKDSASLRVGLAWLLPLALFVGIYILSLCS